MRQRQSSVTTDTQYPVRSIGAMAFALGGGTAACWPRRCAFANVGRSSNEAISSAIGNIGWTDTTRDVGCQAIPQPEHCFPYCRTNEGRCTIRQSFLVQLEAQISG